MASRSGLQGQGLSITPEQRTQLGFVLEELLRSETLSGEVAVAPDGAAQSQALPQQAQAPGQRDRGRSGEAACLVADLAWWWDGAAVPEAHTAAVPPQPARRQQQHLRKGSGASDEAEGGARAASSNVDAGILVDSAGTASEGSAPTVHGSLLSDCSAHHGADAGSRDAGTEAKGCTVLAASQTVTDAPLLTGNLTPSAASASSQQPATPSPVPPPPLPAPSPPLAVGPCGLTHPGYAHGGYLRRPLALQLAWAAAAWRVTGRFPYPAVQGQRPPLLQEGEAYHAAVAEVEGLLPALLPGEWLLDERDGEGEGPASVAGSSTALAAAAAMACEEDGQEGQQRDSREKAAPVASPEGAAHAALAGCDIASGAGAVSTTCGDSASAQGPLPAASPTSSSEPAACDVSAARHRHGVSSSGAGVGGTCSCPTANNHPDIPTTAATTTTGTDLAAATDALVRLLLSARCVYVLLGFRLTAGSAQSFVALPSLRECREAFERRHAPAGNASVLTVGARALTKHTHRDLRGEWWPRMSGSEATKNQVARECLARLLSGAVWLNVHQLPPFDAPKHVLEVRNLQGYGARWAIEGGVPPASTPTNVPSATLLNPVGGPAAATAPIGPDVSNCSVQDASATTGLRLQTVAAAAGASRQVLLFRGFLEPQMEGGHEAGWRH